MAHNRISSKHIAGGRTAEITTEAIEDYAKAIYALEERGECPVSTSALAERLDLAPSTVTAMAKRLADLELVAYTPYHGMRLTARGRRVALEVMRHHRLLEAFLAQSLDMPWDRVHDEAEVLEHYISEDLEQRIAERLGDPHVDPHGDPIPSADLDLEADDTVGLAELGEGATATFTRVSDSDPEMLRYLADRGITPGVELRVTGRQPFGGPAFVVAAGAEHAIGGDLAQAIRVRQPVKA
jgi:DtxR family transcriptional regulator, Mn-dependent transcriptional regulator